uniref:Uncharacterized protein n=1 Tax=Streptomyces sp. FR1 TaxID=349971 RepID=V9Z5S0_9ACTN|nr:hypothetical protein pFRL2_71c [Streptomyces sp. FR1]
MLAAIGPEVAAALAPVTAATAATRRHLGLAGGDPHTTPGRTLSADHFLCGWFVVQGVHGAGTDPRMTALCWALPSLPLGGARRPSRLPMGGQATALTKVFDVTM